MKIESKNLDTFGFTSLCIFCLISGYNQVVMKVVNDGIQPIFCAGLRSLFAALIVFIWLYLTKKPIKIEKELFVSTIFCGFIFGLEFLLLFIALDLTSVIRVTIIFYTMPVWLALMNHFFLPNDKLTKMKTFGLVISVVGVSISVTSSSILSFNDSSFVGDLCAFGGAAGWAYFAFYSKNSKLSKKPADTLMFYAFAVSGPMLIVFSTLYGPFIRDLQPLHVAGFAFQAFWSSAGFVFWMWLFRRYSATTVASFSFVTPITGIFFGWLFLSEQLSIQLFIAGLLVTSGIYFVTKAETR
jgi:drug/metabolite transporter (DMT)-like permease